MAASGNDAGNAREREDRSGQPAGRGCAMTEHVKGTGGGGGRDGRNHVARGEGEPDGQPPEPVLETAANGDELSEAPVGTETDPDSPAASRPRIPVPPTEADLRADGFSSEEVARLISIADGRTPSGEMRDAVVLRKRLEFVRWLVNHQRLDGDSTS